MILSTCVWQTTVNRNYHYCAWNCSLSKRKIIKIIPIIGKYYGEFNLISSFGGQPFKRRYRHTLCRIMGPNANNISVLYLYISVYNYLGIDIYSGDKRNFVNKKVKCAKVGRYW